MADSPEAGLALKLFGDFQAELDGRPLSHFPTAKAKALLIYLAAGPQIQYQRDTLMELLWSGLTPQSAQVNLRQTLFRLRKVVPETISRDGRKTVPIIVSSRQHLELNAEASIELDVVLFQRNIQTSYEHIHRQLTTCEPCLERLRQAAQHYQGEFLSDIALADSPRFEDWLQQRRETFQEQALDILNVLARAAIQIGAFGEAATWAERQLEIDGLRESAYRQLMEALARGGRRSAALDVYERCRVRLQTQCGLPLSARTVALYDQISSEAPQFDVRQPPDVRGYELHRKLGEGTLGAVYRARHAAETRDVALKFIRPHIADRADLIRNFRPEAQIVASLEHPNIVPLYDYWRDPSGAYLVMRWMTGGNLHDALAEGSLPPAQVADILDQIAAALHAAHQAGLTHRNIKPANIFFDGQGNAYLSDFGVVSDNSDAGSLSDRELVVSLAYASPEQIRFQPFTLQSDIYSLALVTYEALTGLPPFAGNTYAHLPQQRHLLQQRLDSPLPRLTEYDLNLPSGIDEVLQRATHQDPAARYDSALAFADDFRQSFAASAVSGLSRTTAHLLGAGFVAAPNPYKGLEPFLEADAERYFGRRALVERLAQPLSHERFLALVGPGGSGKTSLLHAGLVPALRRGATPDSSHWLITGMTPGHHPFEALEAALLRVAVSPPTSLLAPLIADAQGLARLLPHILPSRQGQLLLVIDQLEELFTLVADESERDSFAKSLLTAVTASPSSLRVVLALRADYSDRPMAIPLLAEFMGQRSEFVIPLSASELQEALVRPAEVAGVSLEPDLPELIAQDAALNPGSLPLFQFAMTELFAHRENGSLTVAAYEAIGGVEGALSRRAESLFLDFEPEGRELTRQLFIRLISLGGSPEGGSEDRRRCVRRSELDAALSDPFSSDAGRLQQLLDAYGQYRLLSFGRDPLSRAPTVELAHDVLLHSWPRLQEWIESSREDIREQRQLGALADVWNQAGQEASFLLQGLQLEHFKAWAAATDVALTGVENSFLDASQAAHKISQKEDTLRSDRELEAAQLIAAVERRRAEEQAGIARRLRRRAFFITVALLLTITLASVALLLSSRSTDNAAAVVTPVVEDLASVNQAATIQAEAQVDVILALTRQSDAEAAAEVATTAQAEALALGSQERSAREEAEELAREARARELAAGAMSNLAQDPERSILLALQAIAATKRVDGSVVAEAEEALHHALQASRTIHTLFGTGTGDFAGTLAYSPDGSLLATSGDSGTVHLWNANTGELIRTFPGHEGTVNALSFSPEGRRLLSAGDDSAAIEWDLVSGNQLRDFSQHDGAITAVAYNPDGVSLVTAGEDGSIQLWQEAGSEPLRILTGHEGAVRRLTFNADGALLATAGQDNTARLWDTVTGEEIRSFLGHTDEVLDLSFSPDGSRLATTGQDGTVRLWDVGSGEEQLQIFSPGVFAYAVKFSPDGAQLASGDFGGGLHLWDAASGRQLFDVAGHHAAVYHLAFRPGGQELASGAGDDAVRVWDITPEGGRDFLTLVGHNEPLHALIFNLVGNQLVSVGVSGKAIVWDAATGESRRIFLSPDGGISSAAVAPDGSVFVTGGLDGAVRAWRLSSGELVLEFAGHAAPVRDIAFNSDGSIIATAGENGEIRVSDFSNGEPLWEAQSPDGSVQQLAFSSDGSLLATVYANGEAKLWDTASGEEQFSLDELDQTTREVAFHPLAPQLLTTSADGAATIWDIAGEVAQPRLILQDSYGLVQSAAYSPDGELIATLGKDGAVRLWDAATGTQRLNLGNAGSGHYLDFTPDGRLLAVGGDEGVIYLYLLVLDELIEIARERLTRSWTPEECRRYFENAFCPAQ